MLGLGLPLFLAGCLALAVVLDVDVDVDLALDFDVLDEAADAFTPGLVLVFLPVVLLPLELAVVGTKIAIDCPGLSATGIFNLFQAAMLVGVTSYRLASEASVSPF